MTTPTLESLNDLLARVEAATGPSEELDARILCALAAPTGSFVEQSRFNSAWCIYTAPDRLWEKTARNGWWRKDGWPLTASIDAVLALVERVLPGWCPAIRQDAYSAFEGLWHAMVTLAGSRTQHATWGSTPSLALLAALLRALISQSQAQETGR